jgi:hypothetical protein
VQRLNEDIYENSELAIVFCFAFYGVKHLQRYLQLPHERCGVGYITVKSANYPQVVRRASTVTVIRIPNWPMSFISDFMMVSISNDTYS